MYYTSNFTKYYSIKFAEYCAKFFTLQQNHVFSKQKRERFTFFRYVKCSNLNEKTKILDI